MEGREIIIDASGGILGRTAAHAAKQALLGKKVFVINCSNSIITGRPRKTIEDYKIKRARGGSSLKGPNFPKSPEKIMKRTIRGMLSYKKGRGRDSLKNIKCYDNTPKEFKDKEKISTEREIKTKSLNLERLNREM